MSKQVWARLVRVTLAGALLASAIGVSGAPFVAAQSDDTDCQAIARGEPQIPEAKDDKFNVAMVLIGPHNDGGWSQAHFEGLIHLCETMDDVHVAYIEEVGEVAGESAPVFRRLASQGFDFIIGTSFGYMWDMEEVAAEFPDSTFLHLTGYLSNGENFGNFFGAMEDFKYLAGMLAGSRAKLDGNPKLGYMATFPIPEEIRLGNSIMLGAKETCPECTMDIVWINTWHDPEKERAGAQSLFDRGAQVVFTGADTPAVADVAEEVGRWGVTYDHVDSCTSDACLTAPYWIWGPEYARIAEQVRSGEYVAGYEYFDADSQAMGLYGFMEGETPQPAIADLPEEDVQLVQDTLAAMLAGEFDRFDVFSGEILDNEGNVVVPEGEQMTQADLDQFPPPKGFCEGDYCMLWWADGINANLPELEDAS